MADVISGNVEGFLLHIQEDGTSAQPLYCVFSEGLLQCYQCPHVSQNCTTSPSNKSRQVEVLRVELTGKNVIVRLVPNQAKELPNRFYIIVKDKPQKQEKNIQNHQVQQMKGSTTQDPNKFMKTIWNFFSSNEVSKPIVTPQKFMFSATTPEVQHSWAMSVLNWSRHVWEDNAVLFSYKDECQCLRIIMRQCNMMEKECLSPISQIGSKSENATVHTTVLTLHKDS